MISLRQTESPSEHVKTRSKKMFVRSVAPNKFVVTPKKRGKARRIVNIAVTEAGTIRIECVDKDTGEICPANLYGLHCSHIEAALNRLHANIKRAANRKLKPLGRPNF